MCSAEVRLIFFVYIFGKGMANIFYPAYDECLRLLFRCKDHRLQFWFLNCHSFLLKYPKNNAKTSDTVDFSWFLNLNLGREIKNLGFRTCTDIVPWHWSYAEDTKIG